MMEKIDFSVIDWNQADISLKNIIGVSLLNLDKISSTSSLHSTTLMKVDGWEDMSDIDILTIININQHVFSTAYIITELSYVDNIGVFKVTTENLHGFVDSYLNRYSECFFNGDVIFIVPELSLLFLFQHDGFFISYDLPILMK